MRKIGFIIVFCAIISNTNSQVSFDNYEPIQCKGNIPNDFLASFKLDAIENIIRLEKENRTIFKARQNFILSSYDLIGETLKGGAVLFGDPVSEYLSALLDKILVNKPDLRNKLRIYAIKSGYTNAYCTQQGIIFVTMGILSKVKSEAELAFILMHEISHFTQNHLIERVVETVKKKKSGNYGFVYNSDLVEELLQRSKQNELECDSIAAEYLKNSEFNNEVGNHVMNILLRTHLPFQEESFNLSVFNDEFFKIPDFYLKDQLDKINLDEERFDKYSTHPNVRTRKAAIERIIGSSISAEDKNFLVSESKFREINEIAKFETIQARLYEREYGDAIYSATALKKKYHNNKFLDDIISYSLYGLSKYATINEIHKAAKSVRTIQGESQQIHHLFRQLSKAQINALAIHHINKARINQPDNFVLKEMLKNLILDMPKIGTKIEDIENSHKIQFDNDVEEYKKISDKRKKIIARRALQKKYSHFYLFGLKRDFQDTLLKEFYFEALSEKKYTEKLEEMTRSEVKKYQKKKYLDVTKNGLHITDKKICFIEPMLIFVPKRHSSKRKYLKNIEMKNEFMKIYYSYLNTKLAHIKNKQILTTNDLKSNDTEKFNKIRNLLRWESEKIAHSADDIIPLTTNQINGINQDIDYVCGFKFANFKSETSFQSETFYLFYIADVKSGETKYYYGYQNFTNLSVEKLWDLVEDNLNSLIN